MDNGIAIGVSREGSSAANIAAADSSSIITTGCLDCPAADRNRSASAAEAPANSGA